MRVEKSKHKCEMARLTKLKENALYSAQVYPYNGKVYAEILCLSDDHRVNEYWHTVMSKSFGRGCRDNPKEVNYIDANTWVKKQLELIEKHTTIMVRQPLYLSQKM